MKKQSLKITDLAGVELPINNLQLAVMQADDYRHYRLSNPSANDLYLYEYWDDIYQKLLLLDTEINGGRLRQ